MRPLRLALLLLCVALPATPQSLGELAKKEKERRQKLTPSKVIKDEDLGKARGGTFSGSEAEATPSTADEGEKPRSSASASSSSSQQERLAAQLHAEYQSRYDNKKSRLADEQKTLADCEAARGIYILNRAGPRNCDTEARYVSEVEEELRQIENELMEKARKAGIPPGKVRLR